MAKQHMIEHANGGKWLTPYGFVANRERALHFPTERDADQYLQDNPNLKEAGHKKVNLEVDEQVGRFAGQAATDYDPWGHNRGR